MKIEELFRRDINRIIEEVIKVDLADENIIANELDEYIATEHILEELETVVNAYQESIHNPNETCTVWVSGFFGSGKSSWAKGPRLFAVESQRGRPTCHGPVLRADLCLPPASIA